MTSRPRMVGRPKFERPATPPRWSIPSSRSELDPASSSSPPSESVDLRKMLFEILKRRPNSVGSLEISALDDEDRFRFDEDEVSLRRWMIPILGSES